MSARPAPGRLALMLGFGFASGLPLPLTIFTLQQWFTSYGLSLHAIGLTSLIGLSYTLKFLWSPLFDRMPPLTGRVFGRRRGWLLLVQPLLALMCGALAVTDPGSAIGRTVAAAIGLAFLSASQDILIDAWRIESFAPAEQGAALAAYIWGYRGAMLTSGSGAIYLSTVFGWRIALLSMAGLMACGPIFSLVATEPRADAAAARPPGFLAAIDASFLAPLRDFWSRPMAGQILVFIVLFRLGSAFADTTAAGFYRYRLGFDPGTVAAANFLPALLGTLTGAACGGWLVARLGNKPALMLAGVLRAASLGLYLVLIASGPSAPMLYAKVGLEAFALAMADTTFLAYLSSLCSSAYTATQYALLSSLAAITLHALAGTSGYAAEALGYAPFFLATMLAGVPALLILRRLQRPASNGMAR